MSVLYQKFKSKDLATDRLSNMLKPIRCLIFYVDKNQITSFPSDWNQTVIIDYFLFWVWFRNSQLWQFIYITTSIPLHLAYAISALV